MIQATILLFLNISNLTKRGTEQMKFVKKAMKSAVSKAVKREINEWPPICIGVIYQPIRPERSKSVKKTH